MQLGTSISSSMNFSISGDVPCLSALTDSRCDSAGLEPRKKSSFFGVAIEASFHRAVIKEGVFNRPQRWQDMNAEDSFFETPNRSMRLCSRSFPLTFFSHRLIACLFRAFSGEKKIAKNRALKSLSRTIQWQPRTAHLLLLLYMICSLFLDVTSCTIQVVKAGVVRRMECLYQTMKWYQPHFKSISNSIFSRENRNYTGDPWLLTLGLSPSLLARCLVKSKNFNLSRMHCGK